MLVSISEASRQTGISRTQFYRLRDRGSLKGWLHPSGKIELDGLKEHCKKHIRQRVDPVHGKVYDPPLAVIVDWANASLSDDWSGPPWSAERWVGLVGVWQEASELATRYGAWSPELFARVEAAACSEAVS